uniref:Uncharacterized protein n=1 Tax=Heterosigma akashiwo TaxID=2829 RepID=A0A7S4D7Z0_HETAK
MAEGALARGAALAGLKVATEVPLEEASAAAAVEVEAAAELAMLTLLDTKLRELFGYLDTKVDAAKDGLAAGAKQRKNRAKFLAVDTARAAANRARDKTRQTTQYVSKNINHTKSFVGSKYTGTKDSLFSGAVYLQDKKNAAVTSSVERVKAVAFVLYEAVEPFAVRFPIINKYFRQAEEVAEAAAEFYDDVQEALSEEDGGGGAPAAAAVAPEEEAASPEHSFVRNSPTGATPKHDTAETSINKVPTPRLTYQNSVPKTKEFERPDSVPPTAAAAVEPEAARPEEGSPENADGTDPAPKPPSPMAELMGRISPRRQRPSSSGQALPSNN